jgi:hypothetical protein
MMIRYLSERAKRLGSQAAGRGLVVRIAVGALAFGLASPKLHAQDDFVNYEVGQVNPMAIAPWTGPRCW